MVFILIGAVKAAKHARHEYHKDKKRNALISPVGASQDMMGDPGSSSQQPPSGASEWWGTTPGEQSTDSTTPAQSNHGDAGAWSRDRVLQQISEVRPDNPSSRHASSASASTDMSAAAQRPLPGPSSSTSPSDTDKPSSQRSADIPLPASTSQHEQERDACPDEVDSSIVKRSSLEVESSAVPFKRASSEEINGAVERQSSRKEDFLLKKVTSRRDNEGSANSVKPTKVFTDGSFEEALRRKPSVKGEALASTKTEATTETVSALARNASRGPRRRQSQIKENMSMPMRKGSKAPVTTPEPMEGTAATEVVSALARKASKGPHRRLERPVKASPATGSFEASIESGMAPSGVKGNHADSAGNSADMQKGASAFAGAATKKRVGRRPPIIAQSSGVSSSLPPTTSVVSSTGPVGGTPAAISTVVGSSMYAEGSLKKRTSRR